MKEAVTKVIDTLTQEDFHRAFQKLLERYNKCIAAGGDYFEGDNSLIQELIRKKSGNLSYAPRIYIYIYIYIYIVIYKALCFDVAQGRMNETPSETRTHSCRFTSLACLTVTPPEVPIYIYIYTIALMYTLV